jgi:hypothetical protein
MSLCMVLCVLLQTARRSKQIVRGGLPGVFVEAKSSTLARSESRDRCRIRGTAQLKACAVVPSNGVAPHRLLCQRPKLSGDDTLATRLPHHATTVPCVLISYCVHPARRQRKSEGITQRRLAYIARISFTVDCCTFSRWYPSVAQSLQCDLAKWCLHLDPGSTACLHSSLWQGNDLHRDLLQ